MVFRKLWVLCFIFLSETIIAEDINTEVSLLSNYIYRGESLSSNKPAVQAALDYTHSSGIAIGTFLSSGDKDMPLEIDLYASYDTKINEHTMLNLNIS